MEQRSRLEFFLSYGSTYTYLAVMRLPKLAREACVEVVWRPFSLADLLTEVGLPEGPFSPFPNKLRYMWRDLERRALKYGLPFTNRPDYPWPYVETGLIGILAQQEGWVVPFSQHVYRAAFEHGNVLGARDTLDTAIKAAGHESERVFEMIAGNEIAETWRANTEAARQNGIFGVPSFVVAGELFWGDDRIEDALGWATRKAIQSGEAG